MLKFLTTLILIIILFSPLNAKDGSFLDKFIIGVEADFLNYSPELDSYEINSDELEKDVIDEHNENYDFDVNHNSVNIMLGYEFPINLQIFLKGGITGINHKTIILESSAEKTHSYFVTNKPGMDFSFEMVYTLALTDDLYLLAKPELSYCLFSDMLLVEEYSPDTHKSYDAGLNLFDWNIDLSAGYDLGWIHPFVGITYRDYSMSLDFDGVVEDDFGNTDELNRNIYFKNKSIIGLNAGFKIEIDSNKFFNLEFNSVNGFGVVSSVMFNIK